jgi:hypothetical protein
MPPLPVTLPTGVPNWSFYGGPDMGGPNQIFGASYDAGGNLWVAGGRQGLYVLRPGATRFQELTMADGLRPYGYLFDGTTPPGDKYLEVISVSGAWAGTAFVGYQGKPPGPGELDCEINWDGPNPDPAIYKSGDADKVTLAADGKSISVVHYDISSGQGIVSTELRGREKLCDILRIRYDAANGRVWFAANHGFAMGDAAYAGTANCKWASTPEPPVPTQKTDPYSNDPGHFGCNGVREHVHPAITVQYNEDGSNCCRFMTGYYYGVSVDPVTKDVWFGGAARTTKFHYGSTGGDYSAAQSLTEDAPYISNRIDVWPDAVGEPQIPKPSERVDDLVSGTAALPDGTVWVSSFNWGIAHVDASGTVTARLTTADGLVSNRISALAADSGDGTIWAGANFGGGVSRRAGSGFVPYGQAIFGAAIADQGVVDIQSSMTPGGRRIVVAFGGNATTAGVVAVYSGP